MAKKELNIPERNLKRLYEPKDLGEFDDLACAISIDILLGFQTAKFSKILKSDVKLDNKLLKTVVKNFRHDKDADFAILTMLKSGPLKSFILEKSLNWREGFYKHLLGYLKSFPEVTSGFQIVECWFGTERGAKVIATKDWKAGEKICGLFGSIAHLNEENKKELVIVGENDFSIFHDKNREQLWLGPGRFVNHSCDHNAEYREHEKEIMIKVVRNISKGEEISCNYGKDYFDRFKCLCQTCESNGKDKSTNNDLKQYNLRKSHERRPSVRLTESYGGFRGSKQCMIESRKFEVKVQLVYVPQKIVRIVWPQNSKHPSNKSSSKNTVAPVQPAPHCIKRLCDHDHNYSTPLNKRRRTRRPLILR